MVGYQTHTTHNKRSEHQWMLVFARVLARRVPSLAGAASRTVPAAATWLSFGHADFFCERYINQPDGGLSV